MQTPVIDAVRRLLGGRLAAGAVVAGVLILGEALADVAVHLILAPSDSAYEKQTQSVPLQTPDRGYGETLPGRARGSAP